MATVIKANGTTPAGEGEAFNFGDMAQAADRYLDDVRAQAAKIVAEAHQQAASIRQKAEQSGRLAAEQALEKELEKRIGQQLQTLLPALKQVISEVEQARHDWQRHWQRRAVHTAGAIANRLVRRQLPETPQITETLVREALEMAIGSSEIRVLLNPTDFEHLGSQTQLLATEITQLDSAKVVPHESISPGGCRVETLHGTIDQTFEAQLDRIEEELCQ